jgi:hypothetical protein
MSRASITLGKVLGKVLGGSNSLGLIKFENLPDKNETLSRSTCLYAQTVAKHKI